MTTSILKAIGASLTGLTNISKEALTDNCPSLAKTLIKPLSNRFSIKLRVKIFDSIICFY